MKVLSTVALKGGVGRSTIAVNLAAALAMGNQETGRKPFMTVIIDADSQASSSIMLGAGPGAEEHYQYSLSDCLLNKKMDPVDAVYKVRSIQEKHGDMPLYIMRSDWQLAEWERQEKNTTAIKQMIHVLSEALEDDAIIILDAPPAQNTLVANTICATSKNGLLLVAQPSKLSYYAIRNTLATIKTIQKDLPSTQASPGIMILNRLREDLIGHTDVKQAMEIIPEINNIPFVTVPDAAAASQWSDIPGVIQYSKSKFAQSIQRIADEVVKERS